jgi:voltage-dependent potassium channel beta subunit
MQYRKLGDAGMKISEIALGGWINFGETQMEHENAEKIIVTAYENGINFFDIADVYENGEAEKQIGGVLAQFPRHTLVISTKVFFPMSDEVNDRGLSRKHIFESIEKSLNRIGTDYVDIYFCHRPDPETPLRETVKAMNDLIEQGKVMYWGTSEWPAARIAEASAIAEHYGWHLPRAEQPNYSMLNRSRVEDHILPTTEHLGIGLTVFSPLAQGMLTGKYDDGIPEGSRFDKREWAKKWGYSEERVEKVRKLKPIAEKLGITRAQLALAWILRQPGVSSVITGATKISQVEDNVQAAEVELSGDVLKEIDAVLQDE